MKVLTILQPWASLIVHGQKRRERRSWATAYRGPLAIHAGRRFRAAQRRLCGELPVQRLLVAAGIRSPSALPRGDIVGMVTLVDCIPASEPTEAPDPALGDERYGAYAWLLADPVRLAVPVPYLGQLGLRELPAEVARLLW